MSRNNLPNVPDIRDTSSDSRRHQSGVNGYPGQPLRRYRYPTHAAQQKAVQHALDRHDKLLLKKFGTTIRNQETRVLYAPEQFLILGICDRYYPAETNWTARVVSIYCVGKPLVTHTFLDTEEVPAYVHARAVFAACVTKGINYVVTLLYGDIAASLREALQEFGPIFTGRPYLKHIAAELLTPPGNEPAQPQPRLRTFHFEAVPEGEVTQPPPVEDPDDPPIEHHIRNQTVAAYEWGALKIYMWIAPCSWRGEAIFRYYLTDKDGEHFYTFPCKCWPNKPTKQAVENVLREQGWTLE
jgi:hypothetical protein